MLQMFSPLADYLAKETGEKATLVIPKDFSAFKDMVKAGQVDVAFDNPLIYVELQKIENLEILALAVELKRHASSSSTGFRRRLHLSDATVEQDRA